METTPALSVQARELKLCKIKQGRYLPNIATRGASRVFHSQIASFSFIIPIQNIISRFNRNSANLMTNAYNHSYRHSPSSKQIIPKSVDKLGLPAIVNCGNVEFRCNSYWVPALDNSTIYTSVKSYRPPLRPAGFYFVADPFSLYSKFIIIKLKMC